MNKKYNYFKQVQYLDSIEIEDIGNFSLEAFNDNGQKYYLIIRTVLGISRILQVGPIENGVTLEFNFYFKQLDYDDSKINRIVEKFIGGKENFTQIFVSNINTKEEFKKVTDQFPDIKEFLYD